MNSSLTLFTAVAELSLIINLLQRMKANKNLLDDVTVVTKMLQL